MKIGMSRTFSGKSKKPMLAALMIVLVAAAVTPLVLAQQPTRNFTASISPTSVNVGATESFTITITNAAPISDKQTIKSAAIQVPVGFIVGTLETPTAPAGKIWVAALISGALQLSGAGNNGLDPGQSVSVVFSATAPSPQVTTDYEWTTSAYQDSGGTDTPYAIVGLQPIVTVVVEDPPEEEIVYRYETAYAYCSVVSNKFIDHGFGNWGWSNGPLAVGTYTFEMWAGAGQCDLSKGTSVGTVEVVYGSGTVTVDFALNSGVALEEYHVYAGSEMFPIGSSGKETVAPGQYKVGTGLSGEIYVIVHAVVGIPQ